MVLEKAEDRERARVSHNTLTDYVRIEECLVMYLRNSHLVHLSDLGHLQEYKEKQRM